MLPKAKSISRQNRGCPSPDLAPVAGVALSLLGLLLLTSSFREQRKGAVAVEELPHSSIIFCMPEAPQIFISLDVKGHLSFAASDSALQAATLEKVGKKHGIVFSDSQRAKLKTISYLATTIERIPTNLAVSNLTVPEPSGSYLLDKVQLAECVKTAKLIAPSIIGRPIYFSLLINAKTDMSKVVALITLLQAQGINRFNLQTQY